ncbi:hypothetical protein GGS20DRAFT_592171 [Poronia punctata]|nr:hypothetical protein GGS20DRAFT_592171 [Poronia punctata]
MLSPWITDILAVGFSTLSFLVLIVVLAVQDGKPTFTWHGVTLNTIVAILSTASKASLLFAVEDLMGQWKWILFNGQTRRLIDFEYVDDASRGPLGSLKLMWKFRRSMTLLYFGSFTVLISLVVDPFTQQLVQTRQRIVALEDDDTTVTRAGRYSKGSRYTNDLMPFDHGKDLDVTSVFVDADFSMQSAVLYGLNEPLDVVTQQSPFSCPTGNCTWPAYESLAVCALCHNVTRTLQRLHTQATLYSSLTDPENDSVSLVAGNTTVFRLPNGLQINNLDGWNPDGHLPKGNLAPSPGSVLMTTYGTADASRTVSMQDIDTLIWSVSMLRVDPDPTTTTTKARRLDTWPNVPITATECAIFYCLKRYEPIARDGVFVERASPVENVTRLPDSWWPLDATDAEALTQRRLSSLEFDNYFSAIDRSDLTLASPTSGNTFNVSQAAVDSISSFFKKTLAGTLKTFNDTKYNTAGKLNGWYIKGPSGIEQYQPSWSQLLYYSKNLVQDFTSLAASMSNALRRGADDEFKGKTREFKGRKEVVTVLYRVEWPWIIVHGLSVTVGTLFIALTIWRNGGTQAWGSSSLATMSRGGLVEVQDVLSGAQTLEEMEARAKTRRVVLLMNEKSPSVEDLELDPLQDNHVYR